MDQFIQYKLIIATTAAFFLIVLPFIGQMVHIDVSYWVTIGQRNQKKKKKNQNKTKENKQKWNKLQKKTISKNKTIQKETNIKHKQIKK